MEHYLNLLSILILISSFVLVANKRINAYIKTFRIQSALIAALAAVIGVENLVKERNIDVLIVCLAIILIKVIYIPNLLKKTIDKVDYTVEKDFFLNIPAMVLICGGLVMLSYFSVNCIKGIDDIQLKTYLINSISIILIGLFFMISRKKAIGQIIGFLVIENGLFIAALLCAHGMPMVVDVGIFVDLLTAVMIMGIMVYRINENFDSIDINKLRNLRG